MNSRVVLGLATSAVALSACGASDDDTIGLEPIPSIEMDEGETALLAETPSTSPPPTDSNPVAETGPQSSQSDAPVASAENVSRSVPEAGWVLVAPCGANYSVPLCPEELPLDVLIRTEELAGTIEGNEGRLGLGVSRGEFVVQAGSLFFAMPNSLCDFEQPVGSEDKPACQLGAFLGIEGEDVAEFAQEGVLGDCADSSISSFEKPVQLKSGESLDFLFCISTETFGYSLAEPGNELGFNGYVVEASAFLQDCGLYDKVKIAYSAGWEVSSQTLSPQFDLLEAIIERSSLVCKSEGTDDGSLIDYPIDWVNVLVLVSNGASPDLIDTVTPGSNLRDELKDLAALPLTIDGSCTFDFLVGSCIVEREDGTRWEIYYVTGSAGEQLSGALQLDG